jgi:hypothetical protein
MLVHKFDLSSCAHPQLQQLGWNFEHVHSMLLMCFLFYSSVLPFTRYLGSARARPLTMNMLMIRLAI